MKILNKHAANFELGVTPVKLDRGYPCHRTVAISPTMVDWLLLAGSFALPFFLHQQQFLVGTLVNASLFLSAKKDKFFWPIIVMPSLAVLLRGVIFGPMTVFLFYLMPFIWMGNWLLMVVFRWLDKQFPLGILAAAMAKSFWLFIIARLFFNFHLVPAIFLQTMGINQFITALGGGLIATIASKWTNQASARN